MTNIFAFKLRDGNEKTAKEYILAESDSQATSFFTNSRKNDAQKLYRIGNYLTMFSGDVESGMSIIKELQYSPSRYANDAADGIINFANRFKLNQDIPLTFIVSGYDNRGTKSIYYVDATGARLGRQIHHKVPLIFDGSGSRESHRAFQRDIEKFTSIPTDLIEGLKACYEWGVKAAEDIGSNDKFQLGLISEDGIKTLYHPDVRMGPNDSYVYFKTNLPSVNIPKPEEIRLSDGIAGKAKVLLNDLYNAVITTCGRMHVRDLECNRELFNLKTEPKERTKTEKELSKRLAYRDKEKLNLRDLVTAWNSGDSSQIVSSLDSFYRQRRIENYEGILNHSNISQKRLADYMPEQNKQTEPRV
jgi:20S proteasome alpha/beta subunit